MRPSRSALGARTTALEMSASRHLPISNSPPRPRLPRRQNGRGLQGCPQPALWSRQSSRSLVRSSQRTLFPGSVAYIWHAGTKAGIAQDSLAACGFETRSQIIWAKNNFAIGRGHYHCKHEPCWYVVRKGSTASWVGDHSQTTLHSTGFCVPWPVSDFKFLSICHSMRRPIENNASPGQAVYEPFSGSGTTIIAAEMTDRVCHAIEIAPAYVDVAVKCWQQFTGQQAVLDGDGRSFDNVAAQRAR